LSAADLLLNKCGTDEWKEAEDVAKKKDQEKLERKKKKALETYEQM
jgi:hypothetical protein